MLKFEFDWFKGVKLVENDMGEWEKSTTLSVGAEFSGFVSEHSLVIVPMSMQSGIWDVVVVHSTVDSYSKVGHLSGKNVNETISQALAQVYDIQ